MTSGRDSTLLWSVAGGLLLAAGIVVVVAMRPSDEAPRPAPEPLDAPTDTRTAEAARTKPVEHLAPASLARAAVPTVLPPEAVIAAPVEAAPEGAPAAVPPGAPRPFGLSVLPLSATALRRVQLSVPMAQVLQPGVRTPRPPLATQRLEAMENMVAEQEAQIRQLEGTAAEAERAGDTEGARLRRERLVILQRLHGTLRTQLESMRAERAAAPAP